MSEFGKPRGCNNHCGAMIYFDAKSSVGHPSSDKWVPLEFKDGLKTDLAHICSKKGQNGSLTAVTTTTPNKPDLDNNSNNLAVIKAIAAALNDYIAIKEGVRA